MWDFDGDVLSLQEVSNLEASGLISHEEAMVQCDRITDEIVSREPWYRVVLKNLFPSLFPEA